MGKVQIFVDQLTFLFTISGNENKRKQNRITTPYIGRFIIVSSKSSNRFPKYICILEYFLKQKISYSSQFILYANY